MVFRDAIENLRSHNRAAAHECIVIAAAQAPHRALREIILRRAPHQSARPVDIAARQMFLEAASAGRRIDGDVLKSAARAIYRVDRISLAHMIAFDFARRRRHRPHCVIADITDAVLAAGNAKCIRTGFFNLEAIPASHWIFPIKRLRVIYLERPWCTAFRRNGISFQYFDFQRAVCGARKNLRLRKRQFGVIERDIANSHIRAIN